MVGMWDDVTYRGVVVFVDVVLLNIDVGDGGGGGGCNAEDTCMQGRWGDMGDITYMKTVSREDG